MDQKIFYEKIKKRHSRINPCFMTGKGCVHTEQIEKELDIRFDDKKTTKCFMVRPFRANYDTFNELCLERFLYGEYSSGEYELEIEQADKIRRTGYVVCEKICKRIQAVDFIIVDVSSPNPNVFYELGLAYGIGHKIILIAKSQNQFADKISNYFADNDWKIYRYKDLSPIKIENFTLSNYISNTTNNEKLTTLKSPNIYFIPAVEMTEFSPSKSSKENTKVTDTNLEEYLDKKGDIEISIEDHIGASVGVAIDDIVSKLKEKVSNSIPEEYISKIENLKTADVAEKNSKFRDVLEHLNGAYCAIIQTGSEMIDPMSYFWLGYCHSIGKNVIPVTVVDKVGENIDDLAFDLRALWHMTFARLKPLVFSGELQQTLYQMILTDFAEWSRRGFWDEILDKRGRVSIFSGALRNEPIGREMIGDWDLRAVSELASFFASHQYISSIESPVYQIEQFAQKRKVDLKSGKNERNIEKIREDYISELKSMIKGRNCIIVASADVNPLTEIVLGQIYGVDQKKWFTNHKVVEVDSAVVSFKEVQDTEPDHSDNTFGRIFYKRKNQENDNKLMRGFEGHGVPGGELSKEFFSQKDDFHNFSVHAHLLIVRNPFNESTEKRNYIVLLNGVSGPATFALTHLLTGGTSSKFDSYENLFNPKAKSETLLNAINADLDQVSKGNFMGVQYFVEVQVGPPSQSENESTRDIFDWRRILSWQREGANPGYLNRK